VGAQGRIVAIDPHSKRRKHYTLTIEGHDDLVLHEDVIVSLGLTVGRQIGDADLREIAHEDRVHGAYQAAIRLLSYRSRSRRELATALRQKSFPDGVAEEALAKLENMGLVNDELFARDRARSLLQRHVGRQGLLYRLRQSGVSDEVAREAVAEALEGTDDTERALEALATRLRKWQTLPADKCRAKAYAYLARRGFDSETISSALRTALADQED